MNIAIKKDYTPDYRNIEMSARNIEAPRLPLYEHIICPDIMEQITGRRFKELYYGDFEDKKEYFRHFCGFCRDMGYDTVPHECCVVAVITGGRVLSGLMTGQIQTREDFDKYPWDELADKFFAKFDDEYRALAEVMPAGMKAVGGVGNGVFECVEDLVGYMPLCIMSEDDPELYADMFSRTGAVILDIWERFLKKYGENYCVLRFGDDLGFKSNTLLSKNDIVRHIIPQYGKVITAVHAYSKPFLLHSCGCIFSVMDELIAAGIDAKHSNEDQIAPFPEWVERYGDRIGNFGGIDTDAVCRLSEGDMKEYIERVVNACRGHGGFAFGSGNSIPEYVPAENFVNMVQIVRELRGE